MFDPSGETAQFRHESLLSSFSENLILGSHFRAFNQMMKLWATFLIILESIDKVQSQKPENSKKNG